MPRAPPPPPDVGAPGTEVKAKRKVKVSDSEGTLRTLSAYNLFVREMLRQYKLLDSPQGERLKTVAARWREMSETQRDSWRADGEMGSRVQGDSTYFAPKVPAKPTPYQMFVKAMSAQLRAEHPDIKQSYHIRRIGEMWRGMSPEAKHQWKCRETVAFSYYDAAGSRHGAAVQDGEPTAGGKTVKTKKHQGEAAAGELGV
eukprot:CAMPEP_0179444638 /NCGR_PEP_ID=MMETSP0799-20121207/28075_1 /TAXON_ID=46947 /ORGANISM="Geminigera cryophila, Strain CCMP2564" /LENGTH=199 /DNA_ID=CAMNT_0021231863 /DNA_START=76 /DNA_END=672 /DNA_ORIENTATION=-